MIPAIGFMIAAYGITRLIQVAIEHSTMQGKALLLFIVALPAIGVLLLCAFSLLASATTAGALGGLN